MKTQKQLLNALIFLLISCIFSVVARAQSIESISDSGAEKLNQEEIDAILALNNIKVYKFPVDIPEEQRCLVSLYKQEYDNGALIHDEIIFGTTSPHQKLVDNKVVFTQDGKKVYTPLKEVRIISKKDGRDFSLGVRMGDFEIPSIPVKIDSAFKNIHDVRSFKLPDHFHIGDEIPLVLIGSSWYATNIDKSKNMQKFCLEEEVDPDSSQEHYKKMPHHIIFGIKIFEPR